ncbi:MAG: GH13_11 / GH13 / CBM48, partial [uncultured Solirubrobacteraceae bacterium]
EPRRVAGPPVPTRGELGRRGDELLALQRARRARRAVPVRRERRRRAHPGHPPDRAQLALLPAGRRAGPALRLPRPRPVRAGRGTPVQPAQAAHRSVREGDRGRHSVGGGQRAAVRARGGRSARRRRPRHRRDRQRARDPEVDRHRLGLRLGGRRAAAAPVERDGHLRGARQGLHEAAPGRARAPARHVRRAGVGRGDRAPRVARRDRGRAAARPPHRRRALPRRAGPDELLGLLLDRLPRAARRLQRVGHPRRAGLGVQGHGQVPAPARHRGDPRRRLQPHRRGQPPRPDARLQGHRQRELLPAHA